MTASAPRERLAGAMAALERDARLALAERAGVPELSISLARAGRPVTADAFLRICAALPFDPAPDIRNAPAGPVIGDFDHRTLGLGIRAKRFANKHSIRDGAKAIGVSVTTLSHMENGIPVSIENVLKGCRYVGAHPLGYVLHVKQRLNSLENNEASKRSAA